MNTPADHDKRCPAAWDTSVKCNCGAQAADEIALIEKTLKSVGITSLLNHGAASCVFTEGCCGVSQEHILAYTRKIALHCAVALGSPPEGMAGWISVDERLPQPFTTVLIHPRPTDYCCEGEVNTQRQWSYGEYETGFGHHQIKCKVTHWQPLPTPPLTASEAKEL